ncbi:hypothetical protein BHE74_00012118 [Ensete ventricosum]|nr:hypothetical protein BHE74_00012118 [Ensete ventricosum]RZR91397.1 hypothetical protein BHM03_00019509 [Ensete ventricosum]
MAVAAIVIFWRRKRGRRLPWRVAEARNRRQVQQGSSDMTWCERRKGDGRDGRRQWEERKAAMKAGWKRLDSGRGRATATAGKEE